MAQATTPTASASAEGSAYHFQAVVYWMQQAQRVDCNPALFEAMEFAQERALPLFVVFVVSDRIPDAKLRHYRFMLEGLAETAADLLKLGISFHLLAGDPPQLLRQLAADRVFVFMDIGYLRWQRRWREDLRLHLPSECCREVETDAVIPITQASQKEEYAAATLRGKYLARLEPHLVKPEVPVFSPKPPWCIPTGIPSLEYREGMATTDLLGFANSHLRLDDSVEPVCTFMGGASRARMLLEDFLARKLNQYSQSRNDPSLEIQSGLSPYLHFGQISALEVSLRAMDYCGLEAPDMRGLILAKSSAAAELAGLASFLEELLVRRELAFNFCHFNPDYDNYASIPLWARKSLEEHRNDRRAYNYSLEALLAAETHDPYWNAAQREMMLTGKMHNYLRMYWGKKILEWTEAPEIAYEVALLLNNTFNLDGRDPNSFAGVAWCFGKHDRPWRVRPIFGSVRYMNAAGLERKFRMQGYLERIASISG